MAGEWGVWGRTGYSSDLIFKTVPKPQATDQQSSADSRFVMEKPASLRIPPTECLQLKRGGEPNRQLLEDSDILVVEKSTLADDVLGQAIHVETIQAESQPEIVIAYCAHCKKQPKRRRHCSHSMRLLPHPIDRNSWVYYRCSYCDVNR